MGRRLAVPMSLALVSYMDDGQFETLSMSGPPFLQCVKQIARSKHIRKSYLYHEIRILSNIVCSIASSSVLYSSISIHTFSPYNLSFSKTSTVSQMWLRGKERCESLGIPPSMDSHRNISECLS